MTGSATEMTPPDQARSVSVSGAVAAFVAAHLADRVLQGAGSGATLLWLAPAVLAAVLHRLAPPSRPLVAVAALAAQLAGWLPAPLPGDPSPLVGAALALAGTGAGIIGCVVLDRAVATRTDVGDPRHVRGVATIVVPAVAATMAAAAAITIHAGTAVQPEAAAAAHAAAVSLPARFAAHLAAALGGALVGIPLVLAHTETRPPSARVPRDLPAPAMRFAAAGAVLLATWLAFAGSAPAPLAPFGLLVAALLPWMAHRCGARDATLTAALAAAEVAGLAALDPSGDAVRHAAGGLLVGAAAVAGVALVAVRRASQPTEREVAAQRETAERAAFLDHLVTASGAAWFDWEPATGVARCDDRWPVLLGYAPAEIAPTMAAWEALLHADDVAAARAAIEVCMRDGARFEFTGRFRTKSGAWRSILCRGVAARGTNPAALRIIGTHTDVTHVRELGESARTSVARFRAAMDGSLDAFFLLEPVRTPAGRIEDFVVAHTNRLGAELLGRTEDEVTGRSLSELAPVMKLLGIIDRYGRALAAEETLVDELHIDSPQIRAQHIRQQAVPVGDALAVTIHDTTEHRRLQKALIQSQKMEGLGRLAGGVAHDFNNLLTVIRGYSEMAALALPENDPTRENVQVIMDAADRAADITGRLLTFARRSASETRRVDANDIVGELDRLLMRLIGEDVRLVIERAPAPAWIEIDPGSLEQVLVNLAANARDAMPGGGTLTIRIAHVELTEESAADIPESRPGRFVRIEVADDGAGMSQEVLAHLFEPFFTTKTTGKGTGLGLATSYGVVKQADGFIHVASEEGHGTRVTIHLPRAEEPQAQTAPIELDATALGGGETILVAEDEPSVRNFIAEALRTGGYEVIEAADGAAAIEASRGRAGPIHVLVSDVVMPDFRGPDIAATLCAERTGLRVLYVSGYTADAFEGLGSGDGGPALLRKPFTIMQLLMMVRQVLDSATPRAPI